MAEGTGNLAGEEADEGAAQVGLPQLPAADGCMSHSCSTCLNCGTQLATSMPHIAHFLEVT